MTSRREHLCPGCYIQHYSSERFNIPDGEHPMGIEFYEDDDPRIVQIEDRWGAKRWVVGRTVEPAWGEGAKWVWTVNERGELGGVHPTAIKKVG